MKFSMINDSFGRFEIIEVRSLQFNSEFIFTNFRSCSKLFISTESISLFHFKSISYRKIEIFYSTITKHVV